MAECRDRILSGPQSDEVSWRYPSGAHHRFPVLYDDDLGVDQSPKIDNHVVNPTWKSKALMMLSLGALAVYFTWVLVPFLFQRHTIEPASVSV